MDIVRYIIQLLKEQDQAIVPGLGSFVAEYKSAKIHPIDHSFTPPAKQIVFDNFTPEDDFLIRKIAESENVSLEKAILEVRNFTDNLISEIQNYKSATIKDLGTFTLTIENIIVFTAEIADISDDSFGLDEFKSPAIVRNDFKDRAALETQKARDYEISTKLRKRKYLIIGISTIIITVLIFLVFFTDIFRNILYDTDVKMERPNQQIVVKENPVTETLIDTAGKENVSDDQINEKEAVKPEAVIETVKPEPVKENIKESDKYFLIAGSFKVKENAQKKVNELKSKGYKTSGFVQQNNKGLFVVYYDSFKSKDDAEIAHQKIMKEENPESWVLKTK